MQESLTTLMIGLIFLYILGHGWGSYLNHFSPLPGSNQEQTKNHYLHLSCACYKLRDPVSLSNPVENTQVCVYFYVQYVFSSGTLPTWVVGVEQKKAPKIEIVSFRIHYAESQVEWEH